MMKSYKMRLVGFAFRLLLICAMNIAAPGAVQAATVESLVAEADSAYAKGDYQQCVELYSRAIDENGATASLLFNLGNAYYKNGNEGQARLCLERAKRLDPASKRINNNLEYLQSRVEDANKIELKGKKGSVSPDAKGFFDRMHDSVAADTSSDTWAEMAAMSFILLILALTGYFFSSEVRLKKIGFFSAIIFLFFTISFIIFSEMAASHFESRNDVVLTAFKSSLMEEPTSDAKQVGFTLHRGTKLHILESRVNADGEIGWYKVKLNSDNIGWIQADDVEVI